MGSMRPISSGKGQSIPTRYSGVRSPPICQCNIRRNSNSSSISKPPGRSASRCHRDFSNWPMTSLIEGMKSPIGTSRKCRNVRCECAPKRTSADHSEFTGSRPGASPAIFPPQAGFRATHMTVARADHGGRHVVVVEIQNRRKTTRWKNKGRKWLSRSSGTTC
jgi:hypothetical protein